MTGAENPARIEPCLLEQLPTEIADLISEVGTSATALGHRLHPRTAESLCHLVSMMNCYYSNLIEGHHTRPSDIEKALANDLDTDPRRRDLQLEALSHIRVQVGIDRSYAQGTLPDPVSIDFVQCLHRDFYRDAPGSALQLHPRGGLPFVMVAGEFRSRDEHDIAV